MKLVTKRLILRDIKKKDAKDIAKQINDLKVSRFLAIVPYPYKSKEGKDFVKLCAKKQKEKPRKEYTFGISLKGENKIIGLITLNKVDKFNGTTTIGYWLGQDYWRQGIMTEAFIRVLKFAFNRLRLRRINISASTKNKASNGLIRKMGFKREGLKRKGIKAKATGKVHDEVIYGLLKGEWKR